MECDVARRLMLEKLDGVLPDDQVGPLEEHLSACPDCRDELPLLVALDRVLSQSAVASAPLKLEASVAREIGRQTARRKRVESAWMAAGASVAAGAVTFGLSLAFDLGAVGTRIRSAVGSVAEFVGPVTGSLTQAPGLATSASQEPGTVGFVFAVAAAAAAFLAVSAFRLARQSRSEWR